MTLLPEHSHCLACGDPVEFGKEYCSDACRVSAEEERRRERRRNSAFVLLAGTILVIITVLVAFG